MGEVSVAFCRLPRSHVDIRVTVQEVVRHVAISSCLACRWEFTYRRYITPSTPPTTHNILPARYKSAVTCLRRLPGSLAGGFLDNEIIRVPCSKTNTDPGSDKDSFPKGTSWFDRPIFRRIQGTPGIVKSPPSSSGQHPKKKNWKCSRHCGYTLSQLDFAWVDRYHQLLQIYITMLQPRRCNLVENNE